MKLFKNFVMLAVVVAGSVVAQDAAVAPEVITPAPKIEEVKAVVKDVKEEAPAVKSVVAAEIKKEVCTKACKHEHKEEVCKDAACKQGFLCAAVGALVAVPALALTQIKAHPYIVGAVVIATAVAAAVVYNSKKASDKKRAKRN